MPDTKFYVEIEGMSKVEEALKDMSRATGKNVIRRALTLAVRPLVETATVLIRVKRIRPAIAVSKIRFTKGGAGRQAFAQAMESGATRQEAGEAAHAANAAAKLNGDDDPEITSGVMAVGPTRAAFYGFEFGTIHLPPKPFMRPAWDQHKFEVLENIKIELMDQIEKARKRAAAKAARLARKM